MEPPRSQPCLYENSSIISLSEANPCLNSPKLEGQKQAKDQENSQNYQVQVQDTIQDLELDLNLSDHGSNSELNLINSFELGSSQNSPNSPPQGNETDQRVFSCNYCQRKFYSSQALGGHQNAHKRERTLAKRGNRISTTNDAASMDFFVHDHHPNYLNSHKFSSMASLPLHGSYINNRSLGIQAHSMIHKPSYYGQRAGWSRQAIDQQPAIGRLVPENHHDGSSSNGGVARFDGGRKFSPTGTGLGGYWWDGNSHLKSNKDEMQKLDLSLKL